MAPVYLDGELGISELIGPNTDFAIGAFGGGFADGYNGTRGGAYLKKPAAATEVDSPPAFITVQPRSTIPLNAAVRAKDITRRIRDSDTADISNCPMIKAASTSSSGALAGRNRSSFPMSPWNFPSGRKPIPRELRVVWLQRRSSRRNQLSSFLGARAPHVHLSDAAAQFQRQPHRGHSVQPDRFSSYRLGGILPFASEFPLTLPGYFYQEISAKRFVLLAGQYTLPLDRDNRWAFTAVAATAAVRYVEGVEQPGNWHSGVGWHPLSFVKRRMAGRPGLCLRHRRHSQ